MIAKIIITIIAVLVTMSSLVFALYENTVNGKNKETRSFYGIMISISSIVFTVTIMWLLFLKSEEK